MIQNLHKIKVGQIPDGLLGYEALAGSSDANSIVLIATYEDGRVVFVSDRPGPKFAALAQVKVTGEKSAAYIGIADDTYHVLWNGETVGKYEWAGKLYPSLDGSAIAYPIADSLDHQRYRVIVNGSAGNSFDSIGEIVWHPQKLQIAYVARNGETEHLVLGDLLLPAFERVRGVQFSPGGEIYYWGMKDGNWWLCNANGPIECSEGTYPPPFGRLLFTDNDRMCFWICKRSKWFVRNGNDAYGPWPAYQDVVSGPIWSAGTLAYVSTHRNRARVCRNENAEEEFDAVGHPAVQGNTLAYKARDNNSEFLVLNKTRGRPHDVLWPEEREDATYLEDVPVISATGSLAFVAAVENQEAVVVAAEAEKMIYPSYKIINGQVLYWPGTECVVFGGQNGHDRFVVVGSEVLGPFDSVFSAAKPSGLRFWSWKPEFVNSGKNLRFFCVERKSVFRCTAIL